MRISGGQLIIGLLLSLAFSPVAVAGGSIGKNSLDYSASFGLTNDDNITRASYGNDIVDDNIVTVEGRAEYTIPFNDISYFQLGGTLSLNKYLDFDQLDNNRIGIDASYFIKPVQRFTGIVYMLRLSHENRLYESDLRDGSVTRLGLGLSKRLSELVSLRLGVIDEEIDADEKTFDADNTRIYLDFDYVLSAEHTLYFTINRFDGDIVATTVPTGPIISASSSIVRDDAFLSLTPSRFAYKLAAETTAFKFGDAWKIDRSQGIDASIYIYDAETYYADYDGMIISLFYTYFF